MFDSNYKDGVDLYGSRKSLYDNGQVECDYNYKGRRIHGNFKRWYKSGNIHYEVCYNKGSINGEYKEWYENGNIRYKGYYNKGIEDYDKFKRYSECGKFSKPTPFN